MNISSHKPPESQGPNLSTQSAQNVQKKTIVDQKDKSAQVVSSQAADRVNISGQSKDIADIVSAVNELPDVRNDKVQALKQRVDAGTYSVDPKKVAESIIKSL